MRFFEGCFRMLEYQSFILDKHFYALLGQMGYSESEINRFCDLLRAIYYALDREPIQEEFIDCVWRSVEQHTVTPFFFSLQAGPTGLSGLPDGFRKSNIR